MRKISITLLAMTLIVQFVAGCSKEQPATPDLDDNVALILNFPDDPLVDSITSLHVFVVGDEVENPFQSSCPIDAAAGGQVEIMIGLPAGLQNRLTIHLVDTGGRVDFWSMSVIDIPSEGTINIALTLVQTAFGAASRVKIFRDILPWGSHALDEILAVNGITLGDGEAQYQIFASADMGSADLVPGEDLVIIANDQWQPFYDNYAAAEQHFNDFALNGGVILWEACDNGWAEGSIEQAGISLPARVDISPGYSSANYVCSSAWHLLTGVDSVLQGTYASHEGFTGLPDEAVIFTVDERSLPTLAVYDFGAGWVMVSGQPLEYAYDQAGVAGIGGLLPRIVCYLLGIQPQLAAYYGVEAYKNPANSPGPSARTVKQSWAQ